VRHDTLGLRQLSGPPKSALAFVDFVTSRLRHPAALPGTVELLLSPAQEYQYAGRGVAVDAPNLANVAKAFEDWYDRCDSHPDNVALFYFCGHGVEREAPLLLLEDFGQSRLSMLANAIDILPTFNGMATCLARTQYFFVDACREVPQQLLERLGGSARVLKDPEVVGDDRDCGLLMATSGGQKAYGLAGRPTRFTNALIRALDGLGGRLDGNRWVVDYAGLQRAITVLLRRDDPTAPRQRPQSFGAAGDAVLQLCAKPPVVPLRVSCLPPDALLSAGVSALLAPIVALSSVVAPVAPVVAEGGWEAEVPADFYLLTIDVDPGSPYRSASERIAAWPPYCDLEISLTR
jgi:hypothetical protein